MERAHAAARKTITGDSPMTAPLACFRCTIPGHPWTECDREPAKTQFELDERIRDIIQRWDAGNGEFGLNTKTRIIEIETREFEKARKAG